MKKIISLLLSVILFAVPCFSLTAFAWDDPELVLTADYNAEKGTVTVYYDIMNFAGTESADFRLKYNPDVLEYIDNERTKFGEDLFELSNSGDTLAIVYANLYYVYPEDCREDGSATVCKLNFKVKDTKATETVFIATTTSYNMDPDSVEKQPKRATLKIALNEGSLTKSTVDGYGVPVTDETENNLTKVILAACISAAVLVGGIVAIVLKSRKSETNKSKKQ